MHVGISKTVAAHFSKDFLLMTAAFLACAMDWSSSHCLAECCSTVHPSLLQGFLMQLANPALVQTVSSRAI